MQTAKVLPMSRVTVGEQPNFKDRVKKLRADIRSRQLEDRTLLIQEKEGFAYLWASGSENFLSGMAILKGEGYEDVLFGSHEQGGIFSATLIKKQYATGKGGW
ncbi:MAG: hypothetical protein WAV64_02395 [Candidatus Moraniibacteriota bacterium]